MYVLAKIDQQEHTPFSVHGSKQWPPHCKDVLSQRTETPKEDTLLPPPCVSHMGNNFLVVDVDESAMSAYFGYFSIVPRASTAAAPQRPNKGHE